MRYGYTNPQYLLAFDHSPFIRARPDRRVAGRIETVDQIAADYLRTVTAFVP